MIKITTNGGKLRNEYKVAIDPSLSMIHPGKFKLKFSHFPQEDGFDSEIIQGWETWISAGGWSTWKSGGCSRCDISLYTEGGTHIFTKTWNAMLEMGTECLIIEGSKKQFAQLEKNYSKYANCTLLNHIVTVDGEDVTWYTTDNGYSDSVIPGISEKFNHVNDVLQETHPSKSINEIIRKYGYEKFDFLHLDLEGYDADLIMGLEYFPRLIVFENEHVIHAGKYDGVINFLKKEGYNIIEEGIDTMAVKC